MGVWACGGGGGRWVGGIDHGGTLNPAYIYGWDLARKYSISHPYMWVGFAQNFPFGR